MDQLGWLRFADNVLVLLTYCVGLVEFAFFCCLGFVIDIALIRYSWWFWFEFADACLGFGGFGCVLFVLVFCLLLLIYWLSVCLFGYVWFILVVGFI